MVVVRGRKRARGRGRGKERRGIKWKIFTVQRKETVRESDQKECKRMKYWRRKRKPEREVCGEKDEWIMWKEIRRRNKELILRKK